MNTYLKKSLSLLAIVTLPFAVTAKDSEVTAGDYNLPTYNIGDIQALPQLLDMPTPIASPGLVGKTIYMQMNIDEEGTPSLVRSKVPLFNLGKTYDGERDFAVQLQKHLRNAEFSPALDSNGQPVSVSVILPIKIVERQDQTAIEISLIWDSLGGV